MEAKHTPGPWEIGKLNSHCHAGIIPVLTVAGKGKLVGQKLAASVCGEAGIQEATALLIAAAPDLLEACEFVLDHHGSGDVYTHRDIENVLRAAIAKAKGEG